MRLSRLAGGVWVGLALFAAAIGSGVLSLGTAEHLGPPCLFRALTGIPCPGCGMGHALLDAFQGRWAESFRHHPLGIPFLAIWTLWLLTRRRGDLWRWLGAPAASVAMLGVVLAAYFLRLRGALG